MWQPARNSLTYIIECVMALLGLVTALIVFFALNAAVGLAIGFVICGLALLDITVRWRHDEKEKLEHKNTVDSLQADNKSLHAKVESLREELATTNEELVTTTESFEVQLAAAEESYQARLMATKQEVLLKGLPYAVRDAMDPDALRIAYNLSGAQATGMPSADLQSFQPPR